MKNKFYVEVVLCILLAHFTIPITSEFRLAQMERALSACQVVPDNESAIAFPVALRAMPNQMCNLNERRTSCVFEAKHPQPEGSEKSEWEARDNGYIEQNGCAQCPMHLDSMCTMIRNPSVENSPEEVKTVCCCKSPNCLNSIHKDSEIGWKGRNFGRCAIGNYDSSRRERWKDGATCNTRSQDVTCHMAVQTSEYTDVRSGRNRSRLLLELGCGCPFKYSSNRPQASINRDYIYYCCRGRNCNRETYRMIGFEWIQNTILQQEETEFFARLNFEKDKFRFQSYVGNARYAYPKSVFDSFRAYWTFFCFAIVTFGLIFCNPKRIDELPAMKLPEEKKPRKNDDPLIFGEL